MTGSMSITELISMMEDRSRDGCKEPSEDELYDEVMDKFIGDCNAVFGGGFERGGVCLSTYGTVLDFSCITKVFGHIYIQLLMHVFSRCKINEFQVTIETTGISARCIYAIRSIGMEATLDRFSCVVDDGDFPTALHVLLPRYRALMEVFFIIRALGVS